MLKLFPIETSIYKASSYEECIKFYEKNDYKNIFINFDDQDGKKIVDKITTVNPKQKLFLLNDNLTCLNDQDCVSCKEEFNRQMIIKPVNQDLLSKVISNKFECEGINKDNFTFTMEKINKLIYQEFPYLTYKFNKEYTSFTSEKMTAQIVLFITDLLQEHNIEFKVLDYHKITIINNYY